MRSFIHVGVCVIQLLLLSACGERDGLAPVVEVSWQSSSRTRVNHVVVQGETLYAIAFRYDKDYRSLARWNHLSPPYRLHVSQVIRLKPSVSFDTRSPHRSKAKPKPVTRKPIHTSTPSVVQTSKQWCRPIEGKVVSHFVPKEGKKGIQIAGKKGQIIHAARGGVVAYAGNGLPGYGNLIIIKHNQQYLTAYGNNSRLFVKEGQEIKAGQAIAKIGMVDRTFWGLHFEVRRAGKPVNPMKYIQDSNVYRR